MKVTAVIKVRVGYWDNKMFHEVFYEDFTGIVSCAMGIKEIPNVIFTNSHVSFVFMQPIETDIIREDESGEELVLKIYPKVNAEDKGVCHDSKDTAKVG